MLITVEDQLKRKISVPYPPQRIVSLVPSQTELLADLGLGERVVGITKYCVHPADWLTTKAVIGGTKTVKVDQVLALRPDLVIANKEENDKAQVEALMAEVPVWISDVKDLADALEMVEWVGQLTDTVATAKAIGTAIRQRFDTLPQSDESKRSCLYLIWRRPYMGAGKETFIDAMLATAGLENMLTTSRYPEISLEEMAILRPDVVLLSSEPYPFGEKHIAEIREFLPDADFKIVDGELFSWYGSRLKLAPDYFKSLFKPADNS